MKNISSFAAIFISCLSLFAVIYQSYLSREENKLIRKQQSASVLPYLDTWIEQYDNEFKVMIGNKGIGPAFIKEVNFKTVDSLNNDTLSFDNSDKLFYRITENQPFLDSFNITTSTFTTNQLIPAGKDISAIKVAYQTRNQGKRIREAVLGSVAYIKIIYEDVYGAQWYISTATEAPVKIKH